jgi:hypothetical protein
MIASAICCSSTWIVRSTRRPSNGLVIEPGSFTAIPSAIPQWAATPMTSISAPSPFSAVATPEASPPPPTGTTT